MLVFNSTLNRIFQMKYSKFLKQFNGFFIVEMNIFLGIKIIFVSICRWIFWNTVTIFVCV